MLLEHQHPLVVGVGRSGGKVESDTLTFRLGLLHLLLGQTLATPEPCGGRDRGLRLKEKKKKITIRKERGQHEAPSQKHFLTSRRVSAKHKVRP